MVLQKRPPKRGTGGSGFSPCGLLSCPVPQYTVSLLHCKSTLLAKKSSYAFFSKLYELILGFLCNKQLQSLHCHKEKSITTRGDQKVQIHLSVFWLFSLICKSNEDDTVISQFLWHSSHRQSKAQTLCCFFLPFASGAVAGFVYYF